MNNNSIEIKNLSKKYRLGVIATGTLSQDISLAFSRLNQKNKSIEHENILWALKNINIKIKRGEVLGLIGENGSGKSTILKILSRITSPTSGQVKIKGRIASLLEVGTGFHPELTGLENIFLSGAILGMTRKEINENLKEIIEFSGLEKFIKTPIKRYSSGMKVKLGFSVAAHLTADILLIDEVLAVGDFNFQEKCLEKIGSISKEGKTIIFVSHNMLAISQNCTRVISLSKGEIQNEGKPKTVVENYLLKNKIKEKNVRFDNLGLNKSTSIIEFSLYYKEKNKNIKSNTVPLGSEVFFQISLIDHILEKRGLLFNIVFYSMEGSLITSIGNEFNGEKATYDGINSNNIFSFCINEILLIPGKYFINLYIKDLKYGELGYFKNLCNVKVLESDIYDSGRIPNHGLFFTRSKLVKS